MTYMDEYEYRIWFEIHKDEILKNDGEDSNASTPKGDKNRRES